MIMGIFKWIVFNGVFLTLIWFGFFEGVEGAKNIALFMVWLTIAITSAALLNDDILKGAASKRTVPIPLSCATYAIATSILVWHGYIITGVIYFISTILFAGTLMKVKNAGDCHEAETPN
jgi:hypothetical protein